MVTHKQIYLQSRKHTSMLACQNRVSPWFSSDEYLDHQPADATRASLGQQGRHLGVARVPTEGQENRWCREKLLDWAVSKTQWIDS